MTALRCTFLRQESEESERIVIAATQTFELIFVKEKKVIRVVQSAHSDYITHIAALTDYQLSLTIVSMSLDGSLKFWDEQGFSSQKDFVSQGTQFLTACVVPTQKDTFLVSTLDESNSWAIWAFRRERYLKTIPSFFESSVLDMKLSPFGCHLFVPMDVDKMARVRLDLSK